MDDGIVPIKNIILSHQLNVAILKTHSLCISEYNAMQLYILDPVFIFYITAKTHQFVGNRITYIIPGLLSGNRPIIDPALAGIQHPFTRLIQMLDDIGYFVITVLSEYVSFLSSIMLDSRLAV